MESSSVSGIPATANSPRAGGLRQRGGQKQIVAYSLLVRSGLSAKKLGLLREVVPVLSRVAIMWNPDVRGALLEYKATEEAARSLRLQLQSVEVSRADDISRAFSALATGRAEALIVAPSTLTLDNRSQIAGAVCANPRDLSRVKNQPILCAACPRGASEPGAPNSSPPEPAHAPGLTLLAGLQLLRSLQEHGETLFAQACETDLEGIVGKDPAAPFKRGVQPTWVKARDPNYSRLKSSLGQGPRSAIAASSKDRNSAVAGLDP